MVDVSQLVSTEHKAAFIGTVCKRCGLCSIHTFAEAISPEFCMTVYEGDEDRFIRFLHHIQKLTKTKTTKNLASFEAFCGLFCNSSPECPMKSDACDSLDIRSQCYACFVRQWGQIIPEKVRNDIYRLYSGIDLDTVGQKLSFNARSFRKKDKKALRISKKQTMNILSRALITVVTGKVSSVSKKKSKKIKIHKKKRVHTSTFHNDNDMEWSAKIKELLCKKENYDDETDD